MRNLSSNYAHTEYVEERGFEFDDTIVETKNFVLGSVPNLYLKDNFSGKNHDINMQKNAD